MKRNIKMIEREYNEEKYGSIIGNDLKSAGEYKRHEYKNAGMNCNDIIEYSVYDKIMHGRLDEIKRRFNMFLRNITQEYISRNICELGCGYGYNLYILQYLANVYGGEYSKNAVAIGKSLGYNVQEFNFYKKEDYNIIQTDTTILTCHSIEQLPDAHCFLDGLDAHKKNINYVVHFEPLFLPEITTDIGLKRNEYKIKNDYNTNLLSILEKRAEHIKIIYKDINFMGVNPLNPSSVLVWSYVI